MENGGLRDLRDSSEPPQLRVPPLPLDRDEHCEGGSDADAGNAGEARKVSEQPRPGAERRSRRCCECCHCASRADAAETGGDQRARDEQAKEKVVGLRHAPRHDDYLDGKGANERPIDAVPPPREVARLDRSVHDLGSTPAGCHRSTSRRCQLRHMLIGGVDRRWTPVCYTPVTAVSLVGG